MEYWEVRITRITVNEDDQSQTFETTFQQRIEVAPNLQPILDAYGPSLEIARARGS